MSEKSSATPRELARNRRARHDLEIVETMEAGISLVGTEVKSVRAGRISLDEAWIRVRADGAWLEKARIAEYEQANRMNHDPLRPRRLLIHKRQHAHLLAQTKQQNLVTVPLRVLAIGRWIKLEIGLGKPKKLHDKRETEKTRDAERDIRRATKRLG
ncbi:MAG: SsrA-binding protein SmpB [Planctomycetota bacterium]|nr:SsrA-binding protein SmpB [Planctomycetota bacterium]